MIRSLIVALFNAYSLIMLVYVLMSWIPNSEYGTLGQIKKALATLCEPVLKPFQKLIPPVGGVLDISPMIAIIVLQIVVQFVVRLI